MPITLQLRGDLEELPAKAPELLAKFARAMAGQDQRLAAVVPHLEAIAKSLAEGMPGELSKSMAGPLGAELSSVALNRLYVRTAREAPTAAAADHQQALASAATFAGTEDPNAIFQADAPGQDNPTRDPVAGLYGVAVSGPFPAAAIDYNTAYDDFKPGEIREAVNGAPGVLTHAIEAALPEPDDAAQLVTTVLDSLPVMDGRAYKAQMEQLWADRQRLSYDALQGLQPQPEEGNRDG